MEFYWELILKDGTVYSIAPESVAAINKRMTAHDPVLLSTETIPYSEIAKFRQTSKPYGQNLLEAASQAFNEPMVDDAGELKWRWVKKTVTQNEYLKFYASVPSYRRLPDDQGMVVVAFRLPVHAIDTSRVQYCTEQETQRLT